MIFRGNATPEIRHLAYSRPDPPTGPGLICCLSTILIKQIEKMEENEVCMAATTTDILMAKLARHESFG